MILRLTEGTAGLQEVCLLPQSDQMITCLLDLVGQILEIRMRSDQDLNRQTSFLRQT